MSNVTPLRRPQSPAERLAGARRFAAPLLDARRLADALQYETGDMVRVPPLADDTVDVGTIVGTITRQDYEAHRDHWGDDADTGTGPLYLVNVGNVFTETYEAVYAESEMAPYDTPPATDNVVPLPSKGRP